MRDELVPDVEVYHWKRANMAKSASTLSVRVPLHWLVHANAAQCADVHRFIGRASATRHDWRRARYVNLYGEQIPEWAQTHDARLFWHAGPVGYFRARYGKGIHQLFDVGVHFNRCLDDSRNRNWTCTSSSAAGATAAIECADIRWGQISSFCELDFSVHNEKKFELQSLYPAPKQIRDTEERSLLNDKGDLIGQVKRRCEMGRRLIFCVSAHRENTVTNYIGLSFVSKWQHIKLSQNSTKSSTWAWPTRDCSYLSWTRVMPTWTTLFRNCPHVWPSRRIFAF